MKKIKIIFFLVFYLFIFVLIHFNNIKSIDSITSASKSVSKSSSRTSTVDSSRRSQRDRDMKEGSRQYSEETLRKIRILTGQINNCFLMAKTLQSKDQEDFNILDVYIIADDNESIMNSFSEKEKVLIRIQLKNINVHIQELNSQLEEFDDIDNEGFNKNDFMKSINKLNNQYRAIEWILY